MGISQAIRYPVIVVGITVLVGVFAVTYILPRFSALFTNTRIELPLPTKILLSLDQFTQDYWNIILGIIVVLVATFIRIINTKKGRYEWHKLILSMPIFGPIAKKMAISRFCHVLIP